MKTLGQIVLLASVVFFVGCNGEYKKQLELAKKNQCELVAAKAKLAKSPNDMQAKEQVLRLERSLKTHADLSGKPQELMKEVAATQCP